MKKRLHILSFSALLFALMLIAASCSKTAGTNAEAATISPADTAGLADFQEWKAMNERKDPNLYYAKEVASQPAPVKTETKTVIYKTVPATPGKTETEEKKKGWSKAAKGTVIGTVTGAAAGAIINKKNRLVGGIIGGVLGGGVGYGIGRGMDKKDGRVK